MIYQKTGFKGEFKILDVRTNKKNQICFKKDKNI